MLEQLIKGEEVTMPLMVMSLIAWGVVIERGYSFWMHSKIDLKALRAEVVDLVQQKRILNAAQVCAATPSPVAAVMLAGLQAYDRYRDPKTNVPHMNMVQKAMDDMSVQAVGALERRFNILTTVGNSGPLLGMLGTVIGMIKSFSGLADSSGGVETGQVAAGISIALICTATGLIVALCAVIPYNYFGGKADEVGLQVEEAKSELYEILAEQEQARG